MKRTVLIIVGQGAFGKTTLASAMEHFVDATLELVEANRQAVEALDRCGARIGISRIIFHWKDEPQYIINRQKFKYFYHGKEPKYQQLNSRPKGGQNWRRFRG